MVKSEMYAFSGGQASNSSSAMAVVLIRKMKYEANRQGERTILGVIR